jgi:hypothetical protein
MGCPYVHPYFRTLLQMSSADESRFLEVLVTHNEPVMWLDLACALGLTSAGIEELATSLQAICHSPAGPDWHDAAIAVPTMSLVTCAVPNAS